MRRRYLRNRSDGISYPGLIAAWSAKGKTNEDVDRNILKDLTGNGHDITLNNFAWNTESGYGNSKYPDALVFDGVDDYGVVKSLPSLTDYTVISKIYWITSPNAAVYAYGKAKEDNYPNGIVFSSYSSIGRDISHLFNFGMDNSVKPYVNPVINYHNTKVFNGTPIKKDSAVDDNCPFCLGRIWATHNGLCNMAFYSFYLFNRTLTDQEIKSFIRKHIDPEYLLPSEIAPTPDVYYDFTNGDNSKGEANNIIKDLSGNENDGTAHNFAWNEESGYVEGGLKFDSVDDYISLNNTNNTNIYYNTTILLVKPVGNGNGGFFDQRYAYNTVSKYILTLVHDMAYTITNDNGLVYINGKEQYLNSTLLYNKKHNVIVVNSTINKTQVRNSYIMIGTNVVKSLYTKATVYKILLFRESLTEEQIKAVINKYNLLDGVDNIN